MVSMYLSLMSSLRFITLTELRIPPAFLKFFNGDIPSIAVLEDLGKLSWKRMRVISFKEGWQDFVQENNLEFGELLTFSYAGNSKFYVKIYEKNGSLRTVVTADKELELVPPDEENATISNDSAGQVGQYQAQSRMQKENRLCLSR